jgi:lysozyme|tara:strand:+ start:607 stop:1056 length:450 start_codon:yes stop_codon:yes gene_type:complete
MNKMDRLIEQLKRHEGVETHAYDDTGAPVDCLGKITLGVGRNIDPRGGIGLSMDEIEYLLSNDILRCIKELSKEYPWFGDLDEVRQEAIINIFFNLGATRFRGFKRALAAMETGDYARASVEFLDSRWAKQVGGRALELTDIIRSGEYV